VNRLRLKTWVGQRRLDPSLLLKQEHAIAFFQPGRDTGSEQVFRGSAAEPEVGQRSRVRGETAMEFAQGGPDPAAWDVSSIPLLVVAPEGHAELADLVHYGRQVRGGLCGWGSECCQVDPNGELVSQRRASILACHAADLGHHRSRSEADDKVVGAPEEHRLPDVDPVVAGKTDCGVDPALSTHSASYRECGTPPKNTLSGFLRTSGWTLFTRPVRFSRRTSTTPARASVGWPGLGSYQCAIGIAKFDLAGHLNGGVKQKQRDSILDCVFDGPARSIDEANLRDALAVDPTAQTQEPWPAPTAEVGPWATRLGLGATSPAGSPIDLPTSIWLLNSADDAIPGLGLRVFELYSCHRPVALHSFLQEANGVDASLERVSATVDRGSWRGARRRGAWGPRDVVDDRKARRVHRWHHPDCRSVGDSSSIAGVLVAPHDSH
jgi:hypothetical protein